MTIIIPVTRRVKGYSRFVEKYSTGRRTRFRLYKVYIKELQQATGTLSAPAL